MAANTINSCTWYRFTLVHRPGFSLDIINDGDAHEDGKLQIAPTGCYTGQHWQLIPSLSGQYRLRTWYTGPDMYLDVRSENDLDPHLTSEGPKIGRCWYVVLNNDGTVKLQLQIAGQDYFLGSKYDESWSRNWRPFLSERGDPSQIWKMESVGRVNPNFDTKPHDVGWLGMREPILRQSRYLNVFTLKWQDHEPQESPDPSTVNWVPRFYPWSPEIVQSSAKTLPAYLDTATREVTVIDVSDGFSSPRLLERSEDLRPQASQQCRGQPQSFPETYCCRSFLICPQTTSEGAEVIFCITKGVPFTRQSIYPVFGCVTDVPDWTCSMKNDAMNFTISPMALEQVGREDDIPKGFTWCEQGVDAVFHPHDPTPGRHLGILGYGDRTVVEKVLCKGRVLARKQMQLSSPSVRSAVLKEVEAIREAQEHSHVIKIIGSYTQGSTMGILLHPVAECDLKTALERFEDIESSHYFADRAPYYHFKNMFLESFGCLANGLAFMHAQGIRHSDIEPRNILITTKGPLYSNFGIAKEFAHNEGRADSGLMGNTFIYSAPEVASGGTRGNNADVFSLGCIFLEMFAVLTGTANLERIRSCRNAVSNHSYHANLARLRDLIDELLVDRKVAELDPWGVHILVVIKAMTWHEPKLRPQAVAVWRLAKSLTIDADGLFKVRANICGRCCLEKIAG